MDGSEHLIMASEGTPQGLNTALEYRPAEGDEVYHPPDQGHSRQNAAPFKDAHAVEIGASVAQRV